MVASTAEKAAQFIHITHPSSTQGESILFYGSVKKTDVDHRKAGLYHSTIQVPIPENVPDGDLKVLFGIFNPQSGGRLSITSKVMEGSRVFGGTIRVTRRDGRPVTEIVKSSADDVNAKTLEAPMADFGSLRTNGSFRWVKTGGRSWRMIPVPGSLPYRMEASIEALTGIDDGKGVTVTAVNPWDKMARPPKAEFADGLLKLEVDARSFAYDVEIK